MIIHSSPFISPCMIPFGISMKNLPSNHGFSSSFPWFSHCFFRKITTQVPCSRPAQALDAEELKHLQEPRDPPGDPLRVLAKLRRFWALGIKVKGNHPQDTRKFQVNFDNLPRYFRLILIITLWIFPGMVNGLCPPFIYGISLLIWRFRKIGLPPNPLK